MDQETVWQAYEELEEAMGSRRLAYSLASALDTDTLADVLAFIAKMEDYELSVNLEKEH